MFKKRERERGDKEQVQVRELTIFLPDFVVSLRHLCPPVKTKHSLMSCGQTTDMFSCFFSDSKNTPVWADNSVTCAFFPRPCCLCVVL